jgi:hypothetical protein
MRTIWPEFRVMIRGSLRAPFPVSKCTTLSAHNAPDPGWVRNAQFHSLEVAKGNTILELMVLTYFNNGE